MINYRATQEDSLKKLDEMHDSGTLNNFEYMALGSLYAIFTALLEIRDALEKDKK